MKIIIFAGGSGRRLWPLSLQHSPKQFAPIIGDRSTLRLAVDRVLEAYGPENIFISTNQRYLEIIAQQVPEIPRRNLIGEPERRDLAAAVGLALLHVAHDAALDEPVAILWGDNYMDQVDIFLQVLGAAERLAAEGRARMVFIGETPRFANDNLGWIGLGEKVGEIADRAYFRFNSWHYRPSLATAEEYLAEQSHVWNTGYFVTTARFVLDLYQQHQPEMWSVLQRIGAAIGSDEYEDVLLDAYPQMESLSFDDAILTFVPHDDAFVLHGKMGWSDPGTLYALKEAINPNPLENVTRGLVVDPQSQDCLLYNEEPGKLMAVVGLEGMIVVNTKDAILVVHRDQIKLVKEMVNNLVGTELETYT